MPLLFEGGYEEYFDGVVVVLRDKNDRIKSVLKRDNLSENEVIKRLNSQIDYDNHDFAKYYVIHNNSNLSDLREKVGLTAEQIIKNFKNWPDFNLT